MFRFKIIAGLMLACGIARAQTVGSPIATAAAFQFFDNAGVVLAGGKICTYAGGTSTPLAAYTDSTLTTPQSNPVILDSSGRPTGGSGIYIGTVQYKFIALQGGDGTCSTGVTLWSQDHITNGNTVVNSMAGTITLVGTANQVTVTNSSGTITLSAANLFSTQQFMALASGSAIIFNSANLEIDGNGNLTTTPGITGGNIIAGGYVDTAVWYGMLPSPGTPATSPGGGYSAMIYKGGTDGSHFWLFDTVVTHGWIDVDLAGGGGGGGTVVGTANQITVVTAGGTSTVGLAATATTSEFNALNTGASIVFNSSNVEMDGNGNITTSNGAGWSGGGNMIASGYVDSGVGFGFLPQASAPTNPGSGYAGLMYCTHTTSGCSSGLTFWVFSPSASAWSKVDLAGSAGGLTSINSQTGPAITIAGTANEITVTNTTNTVTLSLPSTTITNEFSALNSGASIVFNSTNLEVDGNGNITTSSGSNWTTGGGNGIFSGYVDTAVGFGMLPQSTSPATNPGSGYGAITYRGGVTGTQFWLFDPVVAHAWVSVDFGGGAGVSSITGTAHQVIASASTGAVTLSLPQSIDVTSAVTFATVSSSGVVFSGATGASNAFQVGASAFKVTGAGDTTLHNLSVTGTCTGCGGGGSGVTSITGTANEIIASASTGAVTLSTPQPIATTSNVQFNTIALSQTGVTAAINVNSGSFTVTGAGNVLGGNYTATGTFNSSLTGSSITFEGNGGTFLVDGFGDISSGGVLNITGTFHTGSCSSGFCMNGTVVVDSSRNVTTQNLTVNGSTITGVVGTSNTGSPLYTMNASYKISNSTGNLYMRVPGASSGVSCAGISDGWFAVTSDDFVVACIGAARFRAALVAY